MADLYRDFVFTRNTVAVAAGDTTVQVEDVSLFPSNRVLARGEFYIAFDSGLSYPHTFEVCRLTNVDTTTKTLTLVRGQAGSTAVGHAIVTYIKGTLNSDQVKRARAGLSGTTAPAPDADVFLAGDRFYHTSEGRYYAFSGNAGYLVDSFTRTASATTMGSTETQVLTTGFLPPATSLTIPYVAPWQPLASSATTASVFGINASGQAYLVSGAAGAYATVNCGSTNFDYSFDAFASTTAASDYGLFFRVDISGQYGYYLQFLNGTAQLYRLSGGSFTSLTATYSTSYSTGVVHTWRVVANGNTISVYRDGSLAITVFTETTTGFTVASATPLIGANIGFRYGNSNAVSDTSLYWDNFLCTTPGNTAANTPLPQGWAPTSDIGGTNGSLTYVNKQLVALEAQFGSVVSQVDDLGGAAAAVESTVAKMGSDLGVVAANYDDLLGPITDLESRSSQDAGVLPTMATQMDEMLDFLKSLALQGTSPPSNASSFPDASLYYDKTARRFWTNVNSTWMPLTYSAAGAASTAPSLVGKVSFNGQSSAFPSGVAVGDLAMLHTTSAYSSLATLPPTGWTVLSQGAAITGSNYLSWCTSYKVLTSADVAAGSISYTNQQSTNGTATMRVYRSATIGPSAQNGAAVTNTGTLTAPTLTFAQSGVLVTFFSASQSPTSLTLVSGQSNQEVTNNQYGYHSIASEDEVIAAAGVTPTRTATLSTSGTCTTINSSVGLYNQNNIVAQPSFIWGTGVPNDVNLLTANAMLTANLVAGTVYVDRNTNVTSMWTGTEWVGVNRRVVTATGDYAAKGNDYILASTTGSGRGLGSATFDTSAFTNTQSNPATVTATTAANALVIGIDGRWNTDPSGFTASIDSGAVTMTRRRTQWPSNTWTASALFTADALVGAGSHTISMTGAISSGISWNGFISLVGCTTTGAVYGGANQVSSLSITLPTGGAGILVLYAQNNTGTPVISSGGGLTFTSRGSGAHGSQNISSQWTAPYTAAQAGTTITVTYSGDASYGHAIWGGFPALPGDPTIYDATNYSVITLPASAPGAEVVVQNNDLAPNVIRVTPASGTINGVSGFETLITRYAATRYVSDGTNWFKFPASTGGGGTGQTVVTRTANYTAANGDVVLGNAVAGGFTITTPAATLNYSFTVKKTDASSNGITVLAASGSIDGSSTFALTTQYDSITLISDGTNWWVL